MKRNAAAPLRRLEGAPFVPSTQRSPATEFSALTLTRECIAEWEGNKVGELRSG